ncbi:hypothetical protein C8F04DRAFT_1317409 [Mycena alexandri]|uniref:4a-hydroxytetrahydrobiopterin dehydratase n=1 Tax=Mycena alexandri TaxID=1745969 RepID=A0AAD6X570_9AGAR|nr:hypothetical protein C8F04DRAFT_1317409 [Mycena alexandri]
MFALRLSRSLYVPVHLCGPARWLHSLPIPTKPKGWPTPWITEDDATNYLFPLYLKGWYLSTVPNDHRTLRVAGLACRFTFPNASPAAAFIKDIMTLTETENHHPCWLRVENSSKNAVVTVCTTTHSALRPEWDPTDTPDDRALEGITLRDLRFAALVTSLPSNTYAPSAEIGPSSTRPVWDELSATLRRWSTPTAPPSASSKQTQKVTATGDILAQKAARTRKGPPICPACRGAHILNACPTRDSIPPPPCTVCQGLHWRVDCPLLKQSQRTALPLFEIKRTLKETLKSTPRAEPLPPTPVPLTVAALIGRSTAVFRKPRRKFWKAFRYRYPTLNLNPPRTALKKPRR